MSNNLPTSFLDQYCTGYQNPGNTGLGYVVCFVLGTGVVPISLGHDGSSQLDRTNAYDKAEADFTSVGQTNMITVSSFCGPHGLVWGYDLARACLSDLPVITLDDYFNGRVPVYKADGLIKAAHELLGSVKDPHFPILPGSHIPCADKNITLKGPATIYCAFALGIPQNRKRHACLLMEDNGIIAATTDRQQLFKNLAQSVLEVGKNQNVVYKEIYVGFKEIFVPENHMGCALVAIPYLALAKKACIPGIKNITLEQWKESTAHDLPTC